ncbi:hypothetical protein M513_08393 [Trichuris suis]|nr:hypothetical protein M513_08393 [Trichuris suis]
MVDASDRAIGTVLWLIKSTWHPLASFLSGFRIIRNAIAPLLIVYTDHKPLVRAFENGSQGLNDREIRQLDFVTSMQTKMRHISGSSNVVADALSRRTYAAVNDIPSARDVAIAQSNDPELQWVRDQSSLKLVP